MSISMSAPVELPGLRVTIDRVVFHPEARVPADRPHCFAYHVTIHNDSEVSVTIRGRKWVVRGDDGEVTVVEGDGVVGQTPLLNPGETFSYNSFHLLRTRTAVAEGAYIGLAEDGRSVFTRIPPFALRVPLTD